MKNGWIIGLGILLCYSFLVLDNTRPIRSIAADPPQNAIELGKILFFDSLLSRDNSISCASCHKPKFAFADTVAFSVGVDGQIGVRNTPSVMNMLSRPYFFYDGRAATLEEQAVVPIENPIEMHLPYAEAVERVQASPLYQVFFQEVYAQAPDSALILNALAEFQRSLESDGSAPHDMWRNGDETALTPAQLRGRTVFMEKGKCFDCHFGPDFTGDEMRNIGLYNGYENTDVGFFATSGDSADLGKMKVPGLRNVALTAPYMSNGMFQTLEEVVMYYNKPYMFVSNPINIDTLIEVDLFLSDLERSDLVAFLHALTDVDFPD